MLALVTALAGTIGGALTAGVHHHFRFRGRGLLHLMLLSPLLLPPVAPAIALLELWGHNGFATRLLGWRSVPVYGFTGLVIAEVMTLLPLAHLMTLVGLSNLDGSLTDQARDMGASEARVLARIVLPGMRGALAGVFLLLVAHATVDIANPLALGGSYPVLSTRLREAAAGEDDMTAAGAYGLILLVICALAALARAQVRSAREQAGDGLPVVGQRPPGAGARHEIADVGAFGGQDRQGAPDVFEEFHGRGEGPVLDGPHGQDACARPRVVGVQVLPPPVDDAHATAQERLVGGPLGLPLVGGHAHRQGRAGRGRHRRRALGQIVVVPQRPHVEQVRGLPLRCRAHRGPGRELAELGGIHPGHVLPHPHGRQEQDVHSRVQAP